MRNGGVYVKLVVDLFVLKRKRIKRKETSVTKADKQFSLFIRKREGKCVRCSKSERLQCSHFWPRGWSATRYDPENCDALCWACHYGNAQGWERAKQGEYRDFKLSQLGEEGYLALEKRAKEYKPRKQAIAEWENFVQKNDLHHLS